MDTKTKQKILPTPLPFYEGEFQSGISDPRYPLHPGIDLEDPSKYERYKGIVDKQKCCAILRGDVLCDNAEELQVLLKVISDYSHRSMLKAPSKNNLLPLDESKVPDTYRVTVTVGFGASLFVDPTGFDRFGIRGQRPKYLKPMPAFPGDSKDFNPSEDQSDLIFIVASDSMYVNVSIARYFAQYINRDCRKILKTDDTKSYFKVHSVEQGFSRPDEREFLRFNDGIDNLRSGIDLEKLVFVDNNDAEPDWCFNGSYMVYRKIRENMPVWEAFHDKKQSEMIGRDKKTSMPLSRDKTGIANLTPVYPDPKDERDGKLNAHIRKVQPRRPTPDLFGINDLDRRFLRRPYPFFDGVDETGKSVNGLHFIAYMKSIQQQFEHVTNMWQMNEDFPVPGTGMDALYSKGVLETISGGYYFCPPAPKDKEDYLGSGLFKSFEQKPYKIPDYVYGFGITFIDIDETVFRTFARVKVIKDGEIVRELDNQQFNTYELADGEDYDFGEFKNAEIFNEQSKPIPSILTRVREIIHRVTSKSEGSRVVFLTARSDFDDKQLFLNTFRRYGIDMDSERVYVERSGNDTENISVAAKKRKVVLKYLDEGVYRRVRLIDDNKENLEEFLAIAEDIPQTILDKVKENHGLGDEVAHPINFKAYIVTHEGKMEDYPLTSTD
ncbi:Dyp-type peroxidase [Aureisphaera galaxeae]|uniref:Dyp-type peroxidase n=1 Tax=Aureisphaera galaxeae TaxID=1538023 RepID=UPI00234FDBDE|nr:Dyp-type peroxidase [Aureisphaera galaxeae]MDC8004301.1 Dyp-type peroxidase [Aureisphaera galaxeae]